MMLWCLYYQLQPHPTSCSIASIVDFNKQMLIVGLTANFTSEDSIRLEPIATYTLNIKPLPIICVTCEVSVFVVTY